MKICVLNRKELEQILKMNQVIQGVSSVYQSKAQGKTVVWPLVAYEFEEAHGAMDIRSGCVFGENLHGLKMLNNFPGNREKGLPPFNGLLMIFDSETGIPLGVMDASYITCMRTGAAGALGVKALARPDSETLLVLGAGKQAMYQIAATLMLMPQLKKVWVADMLSLENAKNFVQECPFTLNRDFGLNCDQITFAAVEDLPSAVGESDVIITITPSRKPVIMKDWVKPGTHFTCIGADMEGKEEIDPAIFTGAKVFADDIPQCMRVGEMELPLKQGYLKKEEICGEIGQLLAGDISGRTNDEEITIFDATGLALLDLVTGKCAIDAAHKDGLGTFVEM